MQGMVESGAPLNGAQADAAVQVTEILKVCPWIRSQPTWSPLARSAFPAGVEDGHGCQSFRAWLQNSRQQHGRHRVRWGS